MMFKKVFGLAMVLALTACGGGKNKGEKKEKTCRNSIYNCISKYRCQLYRLKELDIYIKIVKRMWEKLF